MHLFVSDPVWDETDKTLALNTVPLHLAEEARRNDRYLNNNPYPRDMTTEALPQQILDRLSRIEDDLTEIKEHMVDVDSILTEEDFRALLSYRQEKTSGTLTSHERLKKELGL